MKATLLIRPPRTSCDACEKRDVVVVRVGDQPDPEARNPWERTAELCLPCLLEAVAVFQQEDGNPCSDCEKIANLLDGHTVIFKPNTLAQRVALKLGNLEAKNQALSNQIRLLKEEIRGLKLRMGAQ